MSDLCLYCYMSDLCLLYVFTAKCPIYVWSMSILLNVRSRYILWEYNFQATLFITGFRGRAKRRRAPVRNSKFHICTLFIFTNPCLWPPPSVLFSVSTECEVRSSRGIKVWEIDLATNINNCKPFGGAADPLWTLDVESQHLADVRMEDAIVQPCELQRYMFAKSKPD